MTVNVSCLCIALHCSCITLTHYRNRCAAIKTLVHILWSTYKQIDKCKPTSNIYVFEYYRCCLYTLHYDTIPLKHHVVQVTNNVWWVVWPQCMALI